MPTVKAYKYTKATDEITATALSQKAAKDRYAGAVHQVALRTLHEMFEADRRGLIKTIVARGRDRDDRPGDRRPDIRAVRRGRLPNARRSLSFDLSSVVPSATLEHLGAAVSKNPYGLVAGRHDRRAQVVSDAPGVQPATRVA